MRRCRELAARHAVAAETALAAGDDDGARAKAMQEASALAFDPEHTGARRARRDAARDSSRRACSSGGRAFEDARQIVQRGAFTYFAIAVGALAMFAFPTRHPWSIALLFAENVAAGILVLELARRERPMRSRWYLVALGLTLSILTTGTLMLGPVLVMPVYVIGPLAVWLTIPSGYPSWITVAAHLLGIAPALLLELLGVLPSTFAIENERLVLSANAIELTPTLTTAMPAVSFVWQLAIVVYIIVAGSRIHDAMQERLHAHIWQLEQVLPSQRRN